MRVVEDLHHIADKRPCRRACPTFCRPPELNQVDRDEILHDEAASGLHPGPRLVVKQRPTIGWHVRKHQAHDVKLAVEFNVQGIRNLCGWRRSVRAKACVWPFLGTQVSRRHLPTLLGGPNPIATFAIARQTHRLGIQHGHL